MPSTIGAPALVLYGLMAWYRTAGLSRWSCWPLTTRTIRRAASHISAVHRLFSEDNNLLLLQWAAEICNDTLTTSLSYTIAYRLPLLKVLRSHYWLWKLHNGSDGEFQNLVYYDAKIASASLLIRCPDDSIWVLQKPVSLLIILRFSSVQSWSSPSPSQFLELFSFRFPSALPTMPQPGRVASPFKDSDLSHLYLLQ